MSATHTFRRFSLRAAALTAGALALVAMVAVPASATTTAPRFVAHGPGWDEMYTATTPARSAGYDIMAIGDQQVPAYCIEMGKPMDTSGTFTLAPLSNDKIPTAKRAAWLAKNHATVGTPGNENDEAAATQLAIWAVTDGISLTEATTPYQPVRDRANALVAASAGKSASAGPVGATVEVTAQAQTDGQVQVRVKLTNTTGGAFADQSVTITPQGGAAKTVKTDASGTATATVVAATGSTVSAAWSGTAPAGSLLIPTDKTKQIMVIAESAQVSAQATTVVASADTPVTIAGPPGPQGTQLPYTGGTFGADQMLVGLGALAVGGFAVVGLMRRRAVR